MSSYYCYFLIALCFYWVSAPPLHSLPDLGRTDSTSPASREDANWLPSSIYLALPPAKVTDSRIGKWPKSVSEECLSVLLRMLGEKYFYSFSFSLPFSLWTWTRCPYKLLAAILLPQREPAFSQSWYLRKQTRKKEPMSLVTQLSPTSGLLNYASQFWPSFLLCASNPRGSNWYRVTFKKNPTIEDFNEK